MCWWTGSCRLNISRSCSLSFFVLNILSSIYLNIYPSPFIHLSLPSIQLLFLFIYPSNVWFHPHISSCVTFPKTAFALFPLIWPLRKPIFLWALYFPWYLFKAQRKKKHADNLMKHSFLFVWAVVSSLDCPAANPYLQSILCGLNASWQPKANFIHQLCNLHRLTIRAFMREESWCTC